MIDQPYTLTIWHNVTANRWHAKVVFDDTDAQQAFYWNGDLGGDCGNNTYRHKHRHRAIGAALHAVARFQTDEVVKATERADRETSQLVFESKPKARAKR